MSGETFNGSIPKYMKLKVFNVHLMKWDVIKWCLEVGFSYKELGNPPNFH
jgi:hypothetical protein